MLSEHRLHPASILFALAGSLKAFALPGAAAVLLQPAVVHVDWRGPGLGPGRWVNRWIPGNFELDNWQAWLLLLLILATIAAIVHFDVPHPLRRQRAGDPPGLLFRNERHVPYTRIQNLDATRTVMHRLFGVAEVHIETGGGAEPEARISVLHTTVFEEMRRRIFEGRRARAGVGDHGRGATGHWKWRSRPRSRRRCCTCRCAS